MHYGSIFLSFHFYYTFPELVCFFILPMAYMKRQSATISNRELLRKCVFFALETTACCINRLKKKNLIGKSSA